MGLFGTDKKDEKAKGDRGEWLIPEDSREYVAGIFKDLPQAVEAELYAKAGLNDEWTEFSRKFMQDLTRLAEGKVRFTEFSLDDAAAGAKGIAEAPTLIVSPDKYRLRFTGAPAGEEARSLLQAIILAATGDSGLSETSRTLLAELAEPREVKVFVSPTCPYCPGQVLNALRAAVEKPDLVTFRYVEIDENPEIARKYGVGSVPHTLINDTLSLLGLEPEERFIAELVTLQSAEELMARMQKERGAAMPGLEAVELDLVIIGGGPAGLSAGIYAARAGLKAVVLEKKNVGGAIAVTPVVENYPGFVSVPGAKLVEILATHARQYVDVREFEEVTELKVGKRIEVYSTKGTYSCRAVILATGATWKDLGVPGELKFYGHGVSHCASCDAYLYKDKRVVVVGGGNTALTDALFLKNVGAKEVTIIHRRESLRAQQHLQDSIRREGIPVIWNSVVEAILGEDAVTAVQVRNLLTEEQKEVPTDGVFVAIGELANSDLAVQIGVEVDAFGNILTDRSCRTSQPRVYAAGDNSCEVRQIVTAVSAGATAAMTAFTDMQREKPVRSGENPS